ncbi:hypothetical protein ACOSP6_07465 [Tenacibaculum sp. MEBiC06402]|uniref:hypothetical protein n=1 Tax=unclassified Tenacibaculum TaxID=2635139 RepID=UPI003B9952BF
MRFYYTLLLIALLTVSSCKSNKLSEEFKCTSPEFTNLEEVTDFKKNFTFEVPKHWKTNLYYDDAVSSIYTADTTVSIKETVIIDASFILNPIEIDSEFIAKIKNENKSGELNELISKQIKFLNNDAFYNYVEGKKGKYTYHLLNVFTKANLGFMHIKTEIYGDSLVDQRLCKAINLIDKIRLK